MTRSQPEVTDDGRYIIVNGRRWRATDPHIPSDLKDELVRELMRARRAIKSGDLSARARVDAAKRALGERGEAWWEPTDEGRRTRALATISTLLCGRGAESVDAVEAVEVAQVIGSPQWRAVLPLAESACRAHAHDQRVEVQNDDSGVTVCTSDPEEDT